MTRAFVFPGQGSQAVGMGRDLAEAFVLAREVFEEVDESLKQNLSRLMFEGPEADLVLTENAQPALMAVSLAVVRILEREGNVPVSDAAEYVAGHSLGEYSALAAAGTFQLSDAARLLKTRGQAMQDAVPVGDGAMAAILGLEIAAVEEIAAEAAAEEVCDIANDNGAGQVVVSGDAAAVARAIDLAGARGARRSVMLPVSAPFHCSLLAPAAEVMVDVLEDVDLKAPAVPLVANVTAEAVCEPATIRLLLAQQVTAKVRWRESMIFMRDGGIDTVAELGVGKVLAGLARRIEPDFNTFSICTPADIEAFVKNG